MENKYIKSGQEQETPGQRLTVTLLYALKAAAIALLAVLLLRVGLYTLFPTAVKTPLPFGIALPALANQQAETIPETVPLIEACQVQMNVEMNGTILKEEKTYSVKAGDQINISAFSTESEIQRIGYYSNVNMDIRDIFDNDTVIYLPSFEKGTRIQLFIEAVAANDDGTANTITKTGWRKFILEY